MQDHAPSTRHGQPSPSPLRRCPPARTGARSAGATLLTNEQARPPPAPVLAAQPLERARRRHGTAGAVRAQPRLDGTIRPGGGASDAGGQPPHLPHAQRPQAQPRRRRPEHARLRRRLGGGGPQARQIAHAAAAVPERRRRHQGAQPQDADVHRESPGYLPHPHLLGRAPGGQRQRPVHRLRSLDRPVDRRRPQSAASRRRRRPVPRRAAVAHVPELVRLGRQRALRQGPPGGVHRPLRPPHGNGPDGRSGGGARPRARATRACSTS